jgi:hypothetical protein
MLEHHKRPLLSRTEFIRRQIAVPSFLCPFWSLQLGLVLLVITYMENYLGLILFSMHQ